MQHAMSKAKPSGLVLSLMQSEDIFLWQLRERSKVRVCDLISISSQSIFSNPLLPHAKIDHLITHRLYLPLWLCPLFSPQILLISLLYPLPPSTPSYSATSPSVYLYPSFSKLVVSPVSSHSHSKGIHSKVWHQALLG